MTVYHALGDSLELTAGEWSNFLALAIGNGWQPATPERPAISFDLDVPPAIGTRAPAHTAYALPAGQIISSGDARSLAHALRDAARTSAASVKDRLAEFCLFFEMGGSVLLSASAPPPSAVYVSPDTTQLLRLFLGLTVDLNSALSRTTPAKGPQTDTPETHTIRYQLGK